MPDRSIAAPEAPSARWKQTIERVSPAVVMLRVSMPRAFDDQNAGYQTATGFVVDAERGLILTNRHVVTPGPVVAEAVLLDNEEIEVWPAYRDPVHDFGLFRFDPADVRFMDVVELPLSPERARVGTEIRVIGNDAGEKLSILAGTLARVDRDAPPYGSSSYNDFNTFYYQAASGTSGGSSGSPVIDVDGHVIALNAGASRSAASSFFLPLDRVVRALELIRRGERVTRGTLQAVFRHRPYDELRRLGMRGETEVAVRNQFPEGTGLLVVDQVVPGGPADGVLSPGDVLLRAEGTALNAFLPLEALFDQRVGTEIELQLERGGEPRSVRVSVGDLHSITPSAYVEVGGGVVNVLSYQMARNFSLPVGGVYVADAGYALSRGGVGNGSVITRIGSRTVDSLAAFELAWASVPHGTRVPVSHFSVKNPRNERVSVVEVDRLWFPMRRCGEQGFGRWLCVDSPPPPPLQEPAAREARFPAFRDPVVQKLAPSLVSVEFDVPYLVDGVHGVRFRGAGLIVDAERGLVVVDRETVPIAVGDITVSIAAALRVPGELVWLHPEHDLAVVRYDPSRIGATPAASATLLPGSIDIGDDVWLVGLTGRERPLSQRTTVSRIEPLVLPLLRTPRFRDMNLEAVTVADPIPTIGGVLADRRGRVLAFWASFSRGSGKNLETFVRGIPIDRVEEVVRPLRAGRPVAWRSLGVEWSAIPLSEARDRGLPDAIAQELQVIGGERSQVLSVARREAGSPAEDVFRSGDLLLEIEGQPVVQFADVERASQREEVELRLLRDGKVVDLTAPTRELSGRGTERVVVWAGAVLQLPPRAVALQRGLPPDGVYVSSYFYGSPANRYRLSPTTRIRSVDGQPTPDLDAFLEAVRGKGDRDTVRLELVDLENRVRAGTLRLDLEYWPTQELRRGASGWERRRILELSPGAGAAPDPSQETLAGPSAEVPSASFPSAVPPAGADAVP